MASNCNHFLIHLNRKTFEEARSALATPQVAPFVGITRIRFNGSFALAHETLSLGAAWQRRLAPRTI
jgi:hypothetical protein